jgi:hypothetical protein
VSILCYSSEAIFGRSRRSTSLAGESRAPPPPSAALAAGGWGNLGSRLVYSVGSGREFAGGVVEAARLSVWCSVVACFSSCGGALWSFVAAHVAGLHLSFHGCLRIRLDRGARRSIWRLKKMVKSFAASSAFQGVGSPEPVIGDYPSAWKLTPIQGLRWSSGSGPPPTAPCRRCRRDLGEGPLCNFLWFLGFSVRSKL